MNLHSRLYLKVQWSFLAQRHQIILLSKEGGKVLYTNLKMLVSSLWEIKYTVLMWVGGLQVKEKGKFRSSTQRKQRTEEKAKGSSYFDRKETWASWFPKQWRQQILTFIKTHIGAFSTFWWRKWGGMCICGGNNGSTIFNRKDACGQSDGKHFSATFWLHVFPFLSSSHPLLSISTISLHRLILPPHL